MIHRKFISDIQNGHWSFNFGTRHLNCSKFLYRGHILPSRPSWTSGEKEKSGEYQLRCRKFFSPQLVRIRVLNHQLYEVRSELRAKRDATFHWTYWRKGKVYVGYNHNMYHTTWGLQPKTYKELWSAQSLKMDIFLRLIFCVLLLGLFSNAILPVFQDGYSCLLVISIMVYVNPTPWLSISSSVKRLCQRQKETWRLSTSCL